MHAGAGKPLQATPFKSEERRKQAASGWLFLWILSFGQSKESIAVVGPRTDIKISRRASDTTKPMTTYQEILKFRFEELVA
ncbi:hypothetical protein A1353_02690 [Methylomonas methanica]|uniref:Uncharacterized protein n=1 Tax=Methylomonas methanica TaxID=421 RepID=A0A177LVL7_METMH|nr:hypothetical protein A1353_02690 [Methylomonas methanica]